MGFYMLILQKICHYVIQMHLLSELIVDKLAQIARRFMKCTYSALIK